MKNHSLTELISQLNCVYMIAALEDAPQSQELIRQVIDILRYKMDRKGHIIKVSEELTAVDNFISIFKLRFNDMLQYDNEIDQSCLDVYISHYTIMAFIENSLYHAFKNKEGIWKIKICMKKQGSFLHIKIDDNGSGFDIDKYMQKDMPDIEYGTILSTISRLAGYYKKEDVIKIKSSIDKGTSVEVNIPI